MLSTARGLLPVAVLLSLTAGGAIAQAPPPAPIPVAPPSVQAAPGTDFVPPPAPPPGSLMPVTPLMVAPLAPLPPGSTILPAHDYHPPQDSGGLFANVELDVLGVHLKNRLNGTVYFPDGTASTLQLPGAEMDWTLSPRFELGYHLADNLGSLMFSYRFLSTDGSLVIPDFDPTGDGALRTRLDLQVVDLDYVSPHHQCCPDLDFHWLLGVRLATVFFDNEVIGGTAEARSSNHFFGAGPHAGLDLWYHLGSGFGLFSKLDTSYTIGNVHQSFGISMVQNDGSLFGGAGEARGTKSIPTLTAQIGVGWSPIGGDRLRFTAGYLYEHWWMLGDIGGSRAELADQGLFFRGEVNF